jgi:hypothetical protein
MAEDTEIRMLQSLDVGNIISDPGNGPRAELIDYKQPEEYGPGVWALADIESGEFAGLLRDGAAEGASPVEVEYHGSADEQGLPTSQRPVEDQIDVSEVTPSLPENWRHSRAAGEKAVFQRTDADQYILVWNDGGTWLIMLCAHGGHPYPTPLALVDIASGQLVQYAVENLAAKANDSVEVQDAGEDQL